MAGRYGAMRFEYTPEVGWRINDKQDEACQMTGLVKFLFSIGFLLFLLLLLWSVNVILLQ
jgi:hypothetical protein